MKNIFKNFIIKRQNPLLFYIDKQGNSYFRNYCLYRNDANKYSKIIQIKEAGQALEYRFMLDKRLKYYTIFLTVIFYLLFIHKFCNIQGLIIIEFIFGILYLIARLLCADLYKKKLLSLYGNYELAEFSPMLDNNKTKEYKKRFNAKILICLFILMLFVAPAIILQRIIIKNFNKAVPNYDIAEKLSDIYTKIYPQTPLLLEIKAYTDYVGGDFGKASENYIKAMKQRGKFFSSKDYTKFANLLNFIKKSNGSQNAVDTFNEIATDKILNIEQQIKLLWIKSIFSINNDVSDFVINDYDDLIASLNNHDKKHEFYILSDKAYMLYLMQEYETSIPIYDSLITYANKNKKAFEKELPRLYAERGFAKRQLNKKIEADEDFVKSGIDIYDLGKYEPALVDPGFIREKY